MDHAEAVATFYGSDPPGATVPEVVLLGGPERQLRDACEPIAMHAVWSRRTSESLALLGLDFFAAYVGGRAANLGEPLGAVVAATFAWFEPTVLAAVYETARGTVPLAELTAVRAEATTESLRDVLAGDNPTKIADVLADAVEQADGTGRPLFSGLRSKGRPKDPVRRLWWACDLVREHRGDSHVAAAAAAGVGPVEMNILTELWLGMPLLSYTGTRAWSAETMALSVNALRRRGWLADGALTPAGRVVRTEIEQRTDIQEQSIVANLGDRLAEVCDRLNAWSALCVFAGQFPPDLLKRAAG